MKKINPGHVLVAGCCLSLMLGAGFGIGITLKAADATRNSSGTYSVPNTFTAGTTISSSSVNSNFSDLGTEMTNSLERNGKGGMLAALRGIDGTLAAPALSFTSETGSGLFRNGASDVRMSISGGLRQSWSATGSSVTGTFAASGASTLTGDVTASGKLGVGVAPTKTLQVLLTGTSGATPSSNTSAMFESSGQNDVSLLSANAQGEAIVFGDVASGTRGSIAYFNSANAAADQMQFSTNGTKRVTISNSGLTVGSSGTVISSTIRGTVSWTPGLLVAGACATNTITATGAAAGADVACNTGGGLTGQLYFGCFVTANTCNIQWCNPPNATSSSTPASGTYSCRVFNP